MSDFLGGALAKQDPSERVKLALTRDLESRLMYVAMGDRFRPQDGYAYRGGADLLLKHGTFHPGRETPPQYEHLRGGFSMCFFNALRAAEQDPALRYCEGVYTAGFGSPRLHAWCVAPDGGVVELTMPTEPERLRTARTLVNTIYLPVEHWGYHGVVIDTAFATAHDDAMGLPMLDRSPGEIREQQQDPRLADLDFSEPHDFPILKVPYDPNRKDLP